MMTIERIHAAFLNMEAMKEEAFAKGVPTSNGDGRYSSSPYERLAHAADACYRLMAVWESENHAPDGWYWSHWHRHSYATLVEPYAQELQK